MPRLVSGSSGRSFTLLAVVALANTSCTSDSKAPTSKGRQEVAVWDFRAQTPQSSLRLWPMDPGTPQRKKRALTTTNEQGRLAAVVIGGDPGLSWNFENPVAATFVHVEVEAMTPGPLQLFYATSRCPVFSEACSDTQHVTQGRNVVNFLLDPAFPLRALRLDLPDVPDARLWFALIALRTGAAVDTPFMAREPATALNLGPMGLRLTASGPDPGMTVQTPGLGAARVTALEIVLRGGAALAPQLFWDGPCGSFSEACSAVLPQLGAGGFTHRIALSKHGKWTGRIGMLRLDPGPGAGDYVFERIVLVRDPAD